MASGCLLHPDDVLITTGCQEALSIALRTLTQPGDVVAVDSPSFYGTMQILQANGLKALEIPTDPRTGISLEALEPWYSLAAPRDLGPAAGPRASTGTAATARPDAASDFP